MKRAAFYPFLLIAVAVALFAVWGCDSEDNVGGLPDTGRIGVYPKPASEDFPWTLTGPGISLADTGSVTLEDMEPGTYTVTWGEKNGWRMPTVNPVEAQLAAGSFMTFTTTYNEIGGNVEAGQIIVSVEPAELGASWVLEGDDGPVTGTGTQTFTDMAPGAYTVTWGEVDGFDLPDPPTETLVLVEGKGLLFQGVYVNRAASEFTFIEIPPGTFLMGGGDEFTQANEMPRHQVTLTKGFEMTASEITWAQYERIMGGENPSIGGCPIGFSCTDLAVESVEWLDAVEFCNRASLAAGYDPVYTVTGSDVTWDIEANGYRLPTEAEWEYACRAGSQDSYSSGPGLFNNFSCYTDPNLELVGWYCKNSAWPPEEIANNQNPRIPRVHTAMALAPNDFGLYDMHGNVWEWVWDMNNPYEALPMYDVAFRTSQTDSLPSGSAMISLVDNVGNDNLMRFTNISQRMVFKDLGLMTESITFEFADFDTLANIRINGSTLYIGDLTDPLDFPATLDPGIAFEIDSEPITDELMGGGFKGTITLTGDVESLVIGGTTFMLDEILVRDGNTTLYGHDLLIDFTLSTLGQIFYPDPLKRANYFGCAVTDPRGRPSGTSHMLRGGCYLSTPRNCRSASRSVPAKGQFAGFRIVRTLD